MTEPRHLHPVPPSPSPSSSESQPLTEQDARAVHRKVADQLNVLSDVALIERARQVAQDFKEPGAHQNLSVSQWANLAGAMASGVQREVFDLSVTGGPRHARQARAQIERAIGLLLVVDDSLAGLEDEHEPSA